MTTPMTATIHEEITARIIGAIGVGQTPPWRRRISDRENDGEAGSRLGA